MPTILDTILDYKKEELEDTQRKVSLADLKRKLRDMEPGRDFIRALNAPGLQVIAEIKPASPSKGILRSPCNPLEIARIYAQSGAAAISVLTERRFFGGCLDNLTSIRREVTLPLLRKDFLFAPYQLYEARAADADAVLLIVAILSKEQLQELYGLAGELGLAVLAEVHKYKELDKLLLSIDPPVIGINNRNLETMQTRIETTLSMLADVPSGKLVVSESGIKTGSDTQRLAQAGVSAVLAGEVLMQAEDIGAKLQELLHPGRS